MAGVALEKNHAQFREFGRLYCRQGKRRRGGGEREKKRKEEKRKERVRKKRRKSLTGGKRARINNGRGRKKEGKEKEGGEGEWRNKIWLGMTGTVWSSNGYSCTSGGLRKSKRTQQTAKSDWEQRKEKARIRFSSA